MSELKFLDQAGLKHLWGNIKKNDIETVVVTHNSSEENTGSIAAGESGHGKTLTINVKPQTIPDAKVKGVTSGDKHLSLDTSTGNLSSKVGLKFGTNTGDTNKLYITDKDGALTDSYVDLTKFTKDAFLKEVKYISIPPETPRPADKEHGDPGMTENGKYLVFTFILADGKTDVQYIDVSDLVDIYTQGTGITISDHQVSVSQEYQTKIKQAHEHANGAELDKFQSGDRANFNTAYTWVNTNGVSSKNVSGPITWKAGVPTALTSIDLSSQTSGEIKGKKLSATEGFTAAGDKFSIDGSKGTFTAADGKLILDSSAAIVRLSVNGNGSSTGVSLGTGTAGNDIVAKGNVTAAKFIGKIDGSNVEGAVSNATTAGKVENSLTIKSTGIKEVNSNGVESAATQLNLTYDGSATGVTLNFVPFTTAEIDNCCK